MLGVHITMVKAKFLVDVSEDSKLEEKMKDILKNNFILLRILKRGPKVMFYTDVGIVEYMPSLKKIIVSAKKEIDTLVTALKEGGLKLKKIISEHPRREIKTA